MISDLTPLEKNLFFKNFFINFFFLIVFSEFFGENIQNIFLEQKEIKGGRNFFL